MSQKSTGDFKEHFMIHSKLYLKSKRLPIKLEFDDMQSVKKFVDKLQASTQHSVVNLSDMLAFSVDDFLRFEITKVVISKQD